ncbi:MAG: hypothetical protein Fur0041_11000 [Bacteroidia bacterium]
MKTKRVLNLFDVLRINCQAKVTISATHPYLCFDMQFTKGQIIFAVLFAITFIIAVSWSYLKDKTENRKYFKGAGKILLYVVIGYILLFTVVKLVGRT